MPAAGNDVPAAADAALAAPTAGPLFWVLTENGTTVQNQGHDSAERLPSAEAVVLVLAESDVSWHSLAIPRGPSNRLRAALLGSLEEALLTEPEQLHVAVAPESQPGATAWVAVTEREWISSAIAAIERRGLLVDRVVPMICPGEKAHGHFFDDAAPGQSPEPGLAMADANGIVCLPLSGTLARALLPGAAVSAVRWTALPSVAAAAERWLGQPVHLQTLAERLLIASRTTWNLRQFDMAPRRRGALALRDWARRFLRPTWRPVRVGVAALLVLQILALNVWAFVQRQAIEDRREAQSTLLLSAFPQTRLVRDPPAQMARETDLLRALAGKPGPTDLEALLAAAAAAWPDSQGPAQSLRFSLGQLSFAATAWSPEDMKQFTARLAPAGWQVDAQAGRVQISRSNAP